jgi:hypothetical protein
VSRAPVRRPVRVASGHVRAHAAWRAARLRRGPLLGRLAWLTPVVLAFAVSFAVAASRPGPAPAPSAVLEPTAAGTLKAPPALSRVAALPKPPAPPPEPRRRARRPRAAAPAPSSSSTPAPAPVSEPAPAPVVTAPPAPAPAAPPPTLSPPRRSFDSEG